MDYDALQGSGRGHGKDGPAEDWSQWELRYKKVQRSGALIEAVNLGENRLNVTTTNVSRFTLWLHPQMVDFADPIRITLNGEPCVNRRVTPSLATLLESFERRRDWGLVYPAKITLDVSGDRGDVR